MDFCLAGSMTDMSLLFIPILVGGLKKYIADLYSEEYCVPEFVCLVGRIFGKDRNFILYSYHSCCTFITRVLSICNEVQGLFFQ